jgi:ubiquitin-protein ligase
MIENQMRIEYDLELLKENEYGIDIKISKFLNIQTAEIIIPPSLIDPTISTQKISFLLIFPPNNYPSHPPKLLCLTPFCFPHVADGRDLFSFLVEEWKENLNIASIIEILPEFIKNYFSNGNLFFIGKYYLGEKYNLKFFDRNKCEIKYIKENVNVNGKFVRLNRLCIISDIFFLLFEYEKLNKNNLTLVFWSLINNIKSIKKIIVYKMVIIKWKAENENEEYEMCLTMDNNEMFVEKLFEKMKYFGISFQMKKNYYNHSKKIENKISNEMSFLNDKKNENKFNLNEINNNEIKNNNNKINDNNNVIVNDDNIEKKKYIRINLQIKKNY